MEGKRLEKECFPDSSISALICQGGSKINYSSRLQKKVWLAKLYLYAKNEFYQGLQTIFCNQSIIFI